MNGNIRTVLIHLIFLIECKSRVPDRQLMGFFCLFSIGVIHQHFKVKLATKLIRNNCEEKFSEVLKATDNSTILIRTLFEAIILIQRTKLDQLFFMSEKVLDTTLNFSTNIVEDSYADTDGVH